MHNEPLAEQSASPLVQVSPKSYGTAVSLSAVFGFLGIQHFYLGRWGEGVLDLALSLAWLACFVLGEPLLGLLFLGTDCIHAFIVTIMLLTGNFRDGDGRIVAYPGQRLGMPHSNQDMRRSI